MGSERNTEMDSGILYFTTILDVCGEDLRSFSSCVFCLWQSVEPLCI